ncbi:hypothetical protein [Pedobacter nyackensis]|uniref:Alpha-L-rhamnosidase six-hairpin glycosidase domain-containing protein n=1 Tax=Pedobacter nyackensis TaxID=475255 RepID=A0A1W2CLL4_9SPHI|nr:hypothetical protein [Pedobacter nyackensis]SMC86113.1 hypothetical protein SAMN04488101_10452 [Pedobacter nyackensis]
MVKALFLLVFLFFTSFSWAQEKTRELFIAGSNHNDMVKVLSVCKLKLFVSKFPDEAIKKAKLNSSVLLFADGYPERRLALSQSSFKAIRDKKLKVYIEFPNEIPGVAIGSALNYIKLERGIVHTNKIQGLDSLDLLGLTDHHYITVKTPNSYLLLGKVAGYDKADFGISDVETYPLLFRHQNFIIGTTKLSDAVSSRFGPAVSWVMVWSFILQELGVVLPKGSLENNWIKDLSPSYHADAALPKNAFAKSILRGTDWFYNSRLLIHPSWQDTFLKRTSKDGVKVVYPPIAKTASIGDGKLGIMEGHSSFINADGSQPVRWWLRADCQAEVAYALSSSAKMFSEEKYSHTATNLLDHLFKTSNLRAGERNDPSSPSFGLIGWATTDPDAYYGDDNARTILAVIGAAVNLQSPNWDKYIVEGILGNFRTAGKNGFRGPWFRDAAMQKTNWKALGQREIVNVHPHYEAWLWACYLWLYDKTGHEPLLRKAKEAIAITMGKYPDWKWTNGIQQEYTRMILPLAWLVRVENTDKHREWLSFVCGKLLEDLTKHGAVTEKLGKAGFGRYERIASNAEYGSKEAPLISINGDPVTDLLYTLNFAFFSLNEAAAATGEAKYTDATARIADFMVRAQVNSTSHKDLDGAWFRAFDYKRWDYWASNADSGWGPWGTLTGWTQSWIVNGLILKTQNENLWDNSKRSYQTNDFKILAQEKIKTMLN